MVQELNDKTFKTLVAGATPVIVDFWASWCGPCRMLAPIFEELSTEYAGHLHFAKLSTENYPQLASEHDVTGIPCLIIFRHGQEIERIIGFAPKPALKIKIDAILHKA